MNVLIFEASHGECDVTQFSQLNLNSSFFQWFIICRFIYINLQKWKQLLNVGLLCNIKVIEDTTRNSVTLFRRKFCLIVPVIWKIKVFCLGRGMYMYTLPPIMDEMLSEERQLMKWVGYSRWEFSGWKFSRGEFSRREFSWWDFPGGNFPRIIKKHYFKNFCCLLLKSSKTFNVSLAESNFFYNQSLWCYLFLKLCNKLKVKWRVYEELIPKIIFEVCLLLLKSLIF